MHSTIQLGLPPEQLSLLQSVKELTEKLLAAQNNTVWLTTEEAADRLKVSKQTIEAWRKAGWLRYVQDGPKLFRYKADYLDIDVEKKLGVKAFLAPLTR
ncbi:helix-turn-helix domain-containing protein [Dyadobacter endophyticus]|uniref:helix-turn-helix domain-containing protein n=1 Tax=Dyadobacter endophyticus TaxID=1749036 RepID=UPI003CF5327F